MNLSGGRAVDPHRSLPSETGGLPGEHPGRSRDPLVKTVGGPAWLEFEKPDLTRAERFLVDFGFTVTDRTPEALVLRGHWADTPGLVVRRGTGSRFVGPAFAADARADLDRLARATGRTPDLLALCHRHGITPVRITAVPATSAVSATTAVPADAAWVDARLASGRTTGLRALADHPFLTVLV